MVCRLVVCVEGLALKTAYALWMLASSLYDNVICKIGWMNLIVAYYLIITLLIKLIGSQILVSQNSSSKGHIS